MQAAWLPCNGGGAARHTVSAHASLLQARGRKRSGKVNVMKQKASKKTKKVRWGVGCGWMDEAVCRALQCSAGGPESALLA